METQPLQASSTEVFEYESDLDCENSESLSHSTIETLSQAQLCDVLIQKEYELECAQDMVQSLSAYQSECQRKDVIIRELRKELVAYKQNSHSKDISYVTMEEHLSACESQLQVRTEEVESLKQQVETLKEKVTVGDSKLGNLSIPANQISALQKELSSQTSTILRQSGELQLLRSKQETNEESIDSLRHSVSEKQANVASLQAKMKQLKAMNEDLEQKLQLSESEKEKLSVDQHRRKSELGKLKTTMSEGRLAIAKQDFLEAEVAKTKARENQLAVQLGKVKEEMSATYQRVLLIIADVIPTGEGSESGDPMATISAVQQLVQEHIKVKDQLETTLTLLQEAQKDNIDFQEAATNLHQLWTNMKDELKKNARDSAEPAVGDENIKSALNDLLTSLRGLPPRDEDDCFKTLTNVMEEGLCLLTSYLDVHMTRWTQIVSSTEEKRDKLLAVSEMTDKTSSDLVGSLKEECALLKKECEKLKERLSATKEGHSKASSAQEQEELVTSLVEEQLAKEREKITNEMQSLQEQLKVEKQQAVSEEQERNLALCEELATAKEALFAERNEKDILNAEKAGIEAKLLAVEVTMSEALITADTQRETLRSQLAEEMIGYKEQSHQHALTIVALEEKLIRLMESCKQMKAENEVLTQTLSSSGKQDRKQAHPDQVEKLTKLTDTLRHQLSLASDESCKSAARIKHLECDLQTVKNQFQDREVTLTQQYSDELNDLKLTLSRQEITLEGQKAEIEQLRNVLQEKTVQLSAKELEKSKAVKEVTDVKKNLEANRQSGPSHQSDVVQLGHRCSGEKHSEVITNQREAITQLRQRISELELAKPPVGSHQATLKELSRVRHELLKVKSKLPSPEASLIKEGMDMQPVPTKVLEEQSQTQLQIKSLSTTVSELKDNLQSSERTYKHLVDVICKSLVELEKPTIQSLIEEKDQDKKKELLKQRKKFADSLLKQLKTQCPKKDKLQTTDLKSITTAASLSLPEASPEVTIYNLQSVIESTTEELEEQRRLNQALIKRSVFKESQLAESTKRAHHSCIGN